MLRELTRSYKQLWVRVFDTDGEFLLIEAANVLPKWLNPEHDHNRVWIHEGNLLISRPDEQKANESCTPHISLADAVELVKSGPGAFVNSPLTESEAFYRLEKYPRQITDSVHSSLITIPRRLACAIHALPKSVAPAVEAFYLRDAFALRPILDSATTLKFPPSDFVTTSVKFSKVLFAQLRSQQFEAPSRWQEALRKAPESAASTENADKNTTRLETGMKLTCGFEMLSKNAERGKSRLVREFAIVLDDLEEDGDVALASNEEMDSWPDAHRDDAESWMDINYEDFERELEGKRKADQPDAPNGFGDAQTKADLRKIVSRFEAFLNDESAGLEGAELDDMDFDDDDEEGSEDDSEAEDKDVSFDEEEFSKMMREMMGLPSTGPLQPSSATKGQATAGTAERVDEGDDVDDIRNLSSQMEAELRGHGALRIDESAAGQKKLKGKAGEPRSEATRAATAKEADDDSEDDEQDVDIDYNLAKNLLESFKGQGGMAGPTGNLLGMMGFQLPRDEDDADDQGADFHNAGPSKTQEKK